MHFSFEMSGSDFKDFGTKMKHVIHTFVSAVQRPNHGPFGTVQAWTVGKEQHGEFE